MCQYSEYKSGRRSFGANIPGYAQGCYFPGDEPGDYCSLTGDRCYRDSAEDNPQNCPVQERTGCFCEECRDWDWIALPLTRNGAGIMSCPCGHVTA